MTHPCDITGRRLEVGQSVIIDVAPHNERKGKVDEVFDHAGFVHVRYPGTLSICWPPALRILDPVAKAKKPHRKKVKLSLRDRMLKTRKKA
jgi:hypothetical protein